MRWLLSKEFKYCVVLAIAAVLSSCGSSPDNGYRSSAPVSNTYSSPYGSTASLNSSYQPVASKPAKTPSQLYREANIKQDLIKKGTYGRKKHRSMRPKYITIHSTQNYSAGAWQHSKALRNGKLTARKRKGGNRIGYLTWHFTVDEGVVVQHLPTNEQGEHADFDGPGNNYSIGIEMCEHRGNSRAATLERTAKLTAYLMYKHKIPLRRVVAHYHWPRKGLSPEHKNCPHFLLDNGHPGAKWQWFLSKIEGHYKSITESGGYVAPQQYASTAPTPKPTIQRTSSYNPPSTITPIRSTSSSSYTRSSSAVSSTRYHVVKSSDTLYSLSRRYGTSITAIQRANGLSGTTIVNGRRLIIPSS